MDYRIFIEGNEADISEDFSNQLTFAIDDIKEFSSRNTSFSKTSILPGTARNNKLFGHIFDVGSSNFVRSNTFNVNVSSTTFITVTPDIGLATGSTITFSDAGALNGTYTPTGIVNNGTNTTFSISVPFGSIPDGNYTAKISVNGVPLGAANIGYDFDISKTAKCVILQEGLLIFKGVMRITEIVIDGENVEYEIAVWGELGGLIAAMGDKKLSDLNFAAYNHTLTPANIEASWTAPAGSGYYYGLIDYGYSQDKVNFRIENFRPAFYVKEYIDKIIAGAGYTYTSNFFNTAFFKSLIIPFNGQMLPKEVETVVNATDSSTANSSASGSPGTLVQWDSYLGANYFTANGTNDTLTWNRSDKVNAQMTFTFNYFGAGSVGQNGVVTVLQNGTAIASTFIPNNSGSKTLQVAIELNPNDQIKVNVQRLSLTSIQITSGSFRITGTPTVVIPIGYGELIECNKTIPKNVLQTDFLASIIKLFNLYVDEDGLNEKHLAIEPYIDYYDTTSAPINWDGKLDRSKAYKIRPLSELSSRVYEFKYKDDSDYYNDYYKKKFNESYGSRSFDTGSEFVKDKKTVEVIFSPTPLVGYAGTDRVISAIVKRSDTNVDSNISCNIRILARASAPIACTQWTMTTAASGSTNYNVYPYCGHLDNPDAPNYDLNFGAPQEFYFRLLTAYLSANMFNVYWSFYMSEITDKDSRMLVGKFYLTPYDISQLDFSKLIFINGMLWRLHKVSDYSTNSDELTNCELLKVIDLI